MYLCNKSQHLEVLAELHGHTYKTIRIQKMLGSECQLYISYALLVCVRFTWCKMPVMIMSCSPMHVSALREKDSRTLLSAKVKFTCLSSVVDSSPLHTHLSFLCFLLTHPGLCITHAITQEKGQGRHYSS